MKISNILKGKSDSQKNSENIEKKEIKEKKESLVVDLKPKKDRERVVRGGDIILKSQHVTEKATDLEKNNQYIFKVTKSINKTDIKKAVENLYNVIVLNVKVINIPKKKRRARGRIAWISGYKKAIISLKKGQRIDSLQK